MGNQFKKQLFEQSGLVFLPLLPTAPYLNPQPNFLVINNIFDLRKVDFPTLQGTREPTKCMNSNMSLQYREVIYKEGEEVGINIVNLDTFNQDISLKLLGFLKDEQTLIESVNIINTFLPMIKFKGYLENFKCSLDVDKLQEYVDMVNAENQVVEKIEEIEIIEEDNNNIII